METKLQMKYWKSSKFQMSKILNYPEIMTQGKTPKEIIENMKDAYMLMARGTR